MSPWPRFPIPKVFGWNNPLDPITFMAVFDDDDDELTITASRAFFGAVEVESLVATADGDPTTLEEGVGFTTTSPTVIVIPNASALGAILEQLDFYGGAAATGRLRGIWTGSVAMPSGVTTTIVSVTYDRPNDRILVTLSTPVAYDIEELSVVGEFNSVPGAYTDSFSNPGNLGAIDASTLEFPNQSGYVDFVQDIEIFANGDIVTPIATFEGAGCQVNWLAVTYDDGSDELRIVASMPVLDDLGGPDRFAATINGVSASGLSSPAIVVDSPTTAHLAGWDAYAEGWAPAGTAWTLTAFRLDNTVFETYGYWNGSINRA